MSPIKFEEHIKEKLEGRNIIPSANAWSKLEYELNEQANNKKKKYSKAAIILAASVTVLLMLIPFFEFSKSEHPTENTIEIAVPKADFIPSITNESMLVENSALKAKDNTEENKKVIKNKFEEPKFSGLLKTKAKVAAVKIKKAVNKKQTTSENLIADEALTFKSKETTDIDSLLNQKIELKIANLLAQVQQKEKNNEQVTDKEIEDLLRKAQFEITTDQLLGESKTKALSLLEDVESELDETFKQRVFEALKTSFGKIRTAVVERDN